MILPELTSCNIKKFRKSDTKQWASLNGNIVSQIWEFSLKIACAFFTDPHFLRLHFISLHFLVTLYWQKLGGLTWCELWWLTAFSYLLGNQGLAEKLKLTVMKLATWNWELKLKFKLSNQHNLVSLNQRGKQEYFTTYFLCWKRNCSF